MTTTQRESSLFFLQLLIVILTMSPVFAGARFRHFEGLAAAPINNLVGPFKLLVDQDFAPFSFQKSDKTMVGISVDLALAACAEIKVTCELVPRPFSELLPALEKGEGQAIVSGLKLSPSVLRNAAMTRPYFFSTAQFLTRIGTTFAVPDVKTLAGRRVGVVKGTSHAAFLDKYFERSALISFADESTMFEQLRVGGLDAAFADAVHNAFWLKGSASRGCCVALGEGFIDRKTFSRGLSFVVRADQPGLREGFDFALDKLEEKGITAQTFARYLPAGAF